MLSAVLLSGAVAAAVSAATVRIAARDAPAIASVRLAELTAAWAVEAAGTHASAEDAGAQARRWAVALETALATVAKRDRAVLLPARAVAAGAPDLTGEVRAALAALLDGSPRAGVPETER